MRYLVFAIALLCLAACRKQAEKRQQGSTITNIVRLSGIKIYGSLFTDCNICYSAIGTGVKTYSWQMADGTTSTDATFCHVYAKPRTDTVTLTINGDPSLSASLTVAIHEAMTGITASIAGMKTWRYFEGMFFGDGTSTVTYKQKAELEIVYIDPGTLRIGDDTMRMAATTARDEYVYTKRTDITSLPTTTWNLYLFRKPTGDSMMYGIYRNLKDGDAEVREYYYP